MRYASLLLMIILCAFKNQAQSLVTGKIADSKAGTPLPGVTVKVKSTGKAVSTNSEGVFKIEAQDKDILEITNIGYKTQMITVKGMSELTVLMEASTAELSEIVFVGNRGVARSKTESPVPVDVIKINQVGESTAKPDLMSQLNMAVPAFNYNKQSGADGADAIDLASLRGLGPDQTLVLINGKRQHQTAYVATAGTRGRGNSGTDMNAFPEAAIDRIEVLRDGAAAQYGSDAIAGVINIILKKDIHHLSFTTGVSAYDDHKYNSLNSMDPSQYYTGSKIDGKTFEIGLDYGLPIGKQNGFINFAGNFLTQGKTFRQVPDTNISTNLGKALPVDAIRRAFGDGAVTSGGVMVNSEIPIAGSRSTFYFFGGYNRKHSNVYAYTRNFSANNFFDYSGPQKTPTDANGNLIYVPSIMRIYDPTPGQVDTLNEYFNPQEDVYITDVSFAAGLKGTMGTGWDWDISNVIGSNDFHYFGNKTFNASLPVDEVATLTRFDDGGYKLLQNTASLDISKHFANVAKGLTLSFGSEFRYENYVIYHGEYNSYADVDTALRYYPSIGASKHPASGSQGYPGYQPSDAVNASRTNIAGYLEAQLDVTDRWLIDGAARFENYSDFGFVNTYKFATRYKITDNFNLRGSVSTGFRAPSLAQIHFSNTNTTVQNGNLVYTKYVPNTSPIAKAAGIPSLTQETSFNSTIGFTWKPFHNLSITIDGYIVQIKNRIVVTGQFGPDIEAIAPYLTQYNVDQVQFFANAVNTTNTGLDMVLDYNKRLTAKSNFKILFAGNLQNINIDKISIPTALNDSYLHQQSFYSTREQYFLRASAPHSKFALSMEYSINKFAVGTHITYFGMLTTQGFGYASLPGATAGGPGSQGISDQGLGYDPYVTTDDGKSVVPENFVFHGKATTDLYVSYKFSKHFTWYLGVDNVFNVHPDESVVQNARLASADDSESGGPFDSVQMGFDGTRLFTKLALNF
jgi:iron complex outermembrane receptor protein